MVDLYEITKHWKEGHVVVALLGCFQGGTGKSYHLMPIVNVTRRGLEPRKWIGRLIHEYKMISNMDLYFIQKFIGLQSESW
jgi:hypothetical protein